MSKNRRPWNPAALPLSLIRARKKAVYDSDDDDEHRRAYKEDVQAHGGSLSRRKVILPSPHRPKKGDDVEGGISISLEQGLDGTDETDNEKIRLIRTGGADTAEERDADEVVALPSPPRTSRDVRRKARSPSVEEVLDAIKWKGKLQKTVVSDPPRKSGRSKNGQVAPRDVGRKHLSVGVPPRSTLSRATNARERTHQALKLPLPKSLPLSKTCAAASTGKLGKSASRSPVPYIEPPNLSPAQISAYREWRPYTQPTSQLVVWKSSEAEGKRAVEGFNDGELDPNVLVSDENHHFALAVPTPAASKARRNEKEMHSGTEKPMANKKRMAPSSESSESSGSIPEPSNRLSNKKRAAPAEGPLTSFFRPPIRYYSKKRVPAPSESSESSESSFVLLERTRKTLQKPKGKGKGVAPVRDDDWIHGFQATGRTKNSILIKPRSDKALQTKGGKRKKPARDPDDLEDALTEKEDNILQELEIEQPERFKAKTRLRQRKETPFQRNLRKLKAQKLGIVEESTESASFSDGRRIQQTNDDDSVRPTDQSSVETDDFIVDDGGEVQEGLLPHRFSLNSAQTPEFKFKVVFHYFVLLVVEGKDVLPLTGDTAEYLSPQLEDLRRKMQGFKNCRVRSQIWRAEFVKAIETYPNFRVSHASLSRS